MAFTGKCGLQTRPHGVAAVDGAGQSLLTLAGALVIVAIHGHTAGMHNFSSREGLLDHDAR